MNSVVIPIGANHYARVDQTYLPLVSHYKWYVHSGGYAVSSGGKLLMHHLVHGRPPAGFVTDHVNGDRLDNRRTNLRFITNVANSRYRTVTNKNNTIGFRGIKRQKSGRFSARVQHNGHDISLGVYDTLEEAIGIRIAFEADYGLNFYER
jgi:hypothetical protein